MLLGSFLKLRMLPSRVATGNDAQQLVTGSRSATARRGQKRYPTETERTRKPLHACTDTITCTSIRRLCDAHMTFFVCSMVFTEHECTHADADAQSHARHCTSSPQSSPEVRGLPLGAKTRSEKPDWDKANTDLLRAQLDLGHHGSVFSIIDA